MAPVATPASQVSALVCESLHPLQEICSRGQLVQPIGSGGIGLTTSAYVDLRSIHLLLT